MDIARNEVMSMPEGWAFNQVKAEQPTNTYKEFKGRTSRRWRQVVVQVVCGISAANKLHNIKVNVGADTKHQTA